MKKDLVWILFKLGFLFLIASFFGCTVSSIPKEKIVSSLTYDSLGYTFIVKQSGAANPVTAPSGFLSCAVSPDLPSGLKLENDCRIT